LEVIFREPGTFREDLFGYFIVKELARLVIE
jgi:hypothetical protein